MNQNEPFFQNLYMRDTEKRHRVKGLVDNQDTFGSIKTDNSENIDISQFNQCKEIIFKIKMTETEYKALIKEKAKNPKGK